ncbi:MAG: NAD-dependent epimerase/dehydratase family protein [Proteobacteria bacterium]|nr:NAD-dependent epimerase/dehydratase family protein [Desulfobacula sp.]MBU3953573.1 NAD-dependent epimerase/dehydratase family protein [Pseudomonadota bacterium]MBU4129882.1 NAD-dependent epimerase/dehydratase family protein [Pseudomonadota bacterium]
MTYSGISLVTGAAGFLGSHVVECLTKKGVKVRATARPRQDTSFFERLGVAYVGADLSNPSTLLPLFEGNVDRVFHLGAICNFSTPYEKLYPVNVKGVEAITRLALENKVKKFIHVTSTSVYGYYNGTPYTEKDIRHPENDYGRSKRDGEDVLFKRMEQGLAAIIVRPCTVYGPRCTDGAGKVFSRPSSIAAIPGNGRQLLSNIRAEDVAAALYYLSEKEDLTGEVFNISEDTYPTLGDALKLAAETFGSRPPKIRLPLSLVKLMARIDGMVSGVKGTIPELEYEAVRYLYQDYVVDNSKLKQTGFKLTYPDFYESMKQLGEIYRSARV